MCCGGVPCVPDRHAHDEHDRGADTTRAVTSVRPGAPRIGRASRSTPIHTAAPSGNTRYERYTPDDRRRETYGPERCHGRRAAEGHGAQPSAARARLPRELAARREQRADRARPRRVCTGRLTGTSGGYRRRVPRWSLLSARCRSPGRPVTGERSPIPAPRPCASILWISRERAARLVLDGALPGTDLVGDGRRVGAGRC